MEISNLHTNGLHEVTSLSVDACSGVSVLCALHPARIFHSVKSPCTTATSVVQITNVSET
jgi:cysteine sulfinate desulfinase/cysteine desulfurase-like protein